MVDTRDLRDPQKLGEALLDRSSRYLNEPLSHFYDNGPWKGFEDIPNYPQDESMAVLTAREYRAELEARKNEGDKYAASALEQLDKGERVVNTDPSGN